MRKIASASAAILAALLLLPAIASAETSTPQVSGSFIDPDEGWALPNSSGDIGSQNALFIENSGAAHSALIDNSKMSSGPGQPQVDPTCSSTSDEKCNFSNFSLCRIRFFWFNL